MPKIYVITNRTQTSGRSLSSVVKEVIAGGADAVVLREKDLCPLKLYRLADKIKEFCAGTKTKLFINSSVEVALACDADGVHLGYGSLPLEIVRGILPGKTIGVSVHNREEAEQAQTGRADYILAGHIFSTASKPGRSGQGTEFIRTLVSGTSLPVIGIGGINAKNAGQVIRAGAVGIAVMSLVMESDNICGILNQLRKSMT
ncbi:MAG: thiamine phosphate synthase [Eubacteriales bacterium]|nr:MAG: thiamine phosphate synthase [Firmicutes bacterium HGW-Firmicutes-8]